jgi:hypothetical protein
MEDLASRNPALFEKVLHKKEERLSLSVSHDSSFTNGLPSPATVGVRPSPGNAPLERSIGMEVSSLRKGIVALEMMLEESNSQIVSQSLLISKIKEENVRLMDECQALRQQVRVSAQSKPNDESALLSYTASLEKQIAALKSAAESDASLIAQLRLDSETGKSVPGNENDISDANVAHLINRSVAEKFVSNSHLQTSTPDLLRLPLESRHSPTSRPREKSNPSDPPEHWHSPIPLKKLASSSPSSSRPALPTPSPFDPAHRLVHAKVSTLSSPGKGKDLISDSLGTMGPELLLAASGLAFRSQKERHRWLLERDAQLQHANQTIESLRQTVQEDSQKYREELANKVSVLRQIESHVRLVHSQQEREIQSLQSQLAAMQERV